MKLRGQLASALVCSLLAVASARAFAQGAGGDVVEQARVTYYNLPAAGLKGFRCGVQVDWNAALDSTKTPEAVREQLLPLLEKTSFELIVDASGRPRVSQHFDEAPSTEDAGRRFRALLDEADQMLEGVIQEWSSFLFGPPLPPPTMHYKIEALDDGFRVTAGDEPMIAVETLDRELAIREMIVATQNSTATMHPQLSKGEHGYVPVVIESRVEAAHAATAEMHVEIAYQKVEGFDLPRMITAQSKPETEIGNVVFRFDGYELTR